MTAEEARSMGQDDVRIHLVTAERAPLESFGSEASRAVAGALEAAGVTFHGGTEPSVAADDGTIALGGDLGLHVDRIVALPVLSGPDIPGLPASEQGFVPVDEWCRVVGLAHVHAAGDVADHAVKQGGLACQQADVIALQLAVAAGADVVPEPYRPVLRGRLLTGDHDRFLLRETGDAVGVASGEPLWWPPAKVQSRYLAPYLETQELITLPVRPDREGVAVEVTAAART